MALFLLALSVVLVFAGRQAVKAIVFVVIGLVGAELGASLGFAYLGLGGALLGAVAGFAFGGMLSLLVLPLAIGLGLGYLGYSVSQQLVSIWLLSLLIGVGLLVAGVILTGRLLILISVVLGGLILCDVLLAFGLAGPFAASGAVFVAIIGFVFQNKHLSQNHRYSS